MMNCVAVLLAALPAAALAAPQVSCDDKGLCYDGLADEWYQADSSYELLRCPESAPYKNRNGDGCCTTRTNQYICVACSDCTYVDRTAPIVSMKSKITLYIPTFCAGQTREN